MGKGARCPLRFCSHFPHPENIPYKQLQLNKDNVEGMLSKPFMLAKLSLLLLLLPAAESPPMVQRDIFLETGPLQRGQNLSLR